MTVGTADLADAVAVTVATDAGPAGTLDAEARSAVIVGATGFTEPGLAGYYTLSFSVACARRCIDAARYRRTGLSVIREARVTDNVIDPSSPYQPIGIVRAGSRKH